MKKYLVLVGWIALGFILVEVSSSILGSFNNTAVSAFEFVLWWGCFVIGVFQYFKIKKAEKISFLVDSGFYEVSSVSSMSRIELNVRFKLQKQHPSDDLSSLTMEELNARLFEEFKSGVESAGRGVRAIVDGVKTGYRSSKNTIGGSETSLINQSSSKSKSLSSTSGSETSQSSYDLLEKNQYYKQLVRQIRDYELKIESMKSKIDDAQRSYEKYASVGDEHNNRIASSLREEKSKIEIDVRKNEKEMYELIQRKRFEEDRAQAKSKS